MFLFSKGPWSWVGSFLESVIKKFTLTITPLGTKSSKHKFPPSSFAVHSYLTLKFQLKLTLIKFNWTLDKHIKMYSLEIIMFDKWTNYILSDLLSQVLLKSYYWLPTWKRISGVNFIIILYMNFSYESVLSSFSLHTARL